MRMTRVSRSVARAGALLGGLLVFAPGALAAETERYTLAVVPHQLPMNVYENWSPLVERLSRRLGAEIELKVYRTIPSFEEELLQGVPDLAFMNPYHQVMARKAQGYVPLVRSRRTLTGILVVRHDSPARSAQGLDGKTIAFPAPNAFGASLYMRALLIGRLGIRFTPYYVDAHSEVYRHVIFGEAAAGGGIRSTLEREPDEVKAQLRILYETPATAPHCLSAHPRVPARVRAVVVEAILEAAADESGATLLEGVQLAAPVAADYRRDYQPLEQLGLEKYVVIGR